MFFKDDDDTPSEEKDQWKRLEAIAIERAARQHPDWTWLQLKDYAIREVLSVRNRT